MADEFGGVETPDVDVDAGLDVEVSTDEAATEVAETPTEVEAPGQDPQGEFHAVKDGRLSADAKATIEKLKAENPQLAKAVQRALFAEDRLRRELPGGFKEVAQLRQTVEQLGGETGIQEMQGEVTGWREFDKLYTSGDAKALEFMTETPEAQQAFLQIAPQAFEKFREMHPEGYSSYVSKVFTADMQAEGIPIALERLQDFIGDNPKAMEVWQKLAAYVNRIGTFASKDAKLPEMKSTAAQGPDPERQKFETERDQFTRTQWKSESERQHGQIFGDAWKRLASDVPKEKVDLVKKLYGLHLQDQLAKRKDFDSNMNRFFSAKQQDGFLKLHKATFSEVVPLAIRAAKLEAGVGSRKAAIAAKPALANGNSAPAAPVPGYQMLPTKPSIDTINRNSTTPKMWQEHQAILRDGKKVTWK